MKTLSELLSRVSTLSIRGDLNKEVKSLCFDSRQVTQGVVFFAIPGTKTDGHAYIEQAIRAGSVAVVCEKPFEDSADVVIIQVKDVSLAMGYMASAWYDYPSEKLCLIGITGTNGKTTTATLLYRLFSRLGHPSGLLSTIENFVVREVYPAHHTTPDALEINKLLADMVKAGCEYCFMEVSSHALVQNRVAGLHFAGGLFSNITHDHLDFHKTFDAYIQAKKSFFDNLSPNAFALVNKDDRNGLYMVQNSEAKIKTYALHSMADFRASILENHLEGMLLSIQGIQAWTRFIGEFNAYNLLCVYGAAVCIGQNPEAVLRELTLLTPVSGRFETIRSEQGVLAIVDYAHTPDALKNVLEAIHRLSGMEHRKIITVVGAGGDRDKTKRPVMASIAYENSRQLILTSDNPRSESPERILQDMLEGIAAVDRSRVLVIPDRREAIKAACLLACPGDVILLAGKGHENYQEIQGVRYPFDDKEELQKILNPSSLTI